MANLAALQALAARQAGRDPYVTRRTAEITSGIDDLVPQADSYDVNAAQDEAFKSSGGTWAPSRDSLRTSAYDKLKSLLGQQSIKHQQGMEKLDLEGRYDVEKERVGNEATMDRFYAQQEALDRRQGNSIEAQDARTKMQIEAAMARQQQGQQFKQENPTASNAVVPGGMYDGLAAAQKKYADSRGWLGSVKRWASGGADPQAEAYQQQLQNILDRKGTLSFIETDEVAGVLGRTAGATVDERIANSGKRGLQRLDPTERAYLAMKLKLQQ